jgi:hypothetical protein
MRQTSVLGFVMVSGFFACMFDTGDREGTGELASSDDAELSAAREVRVLLYGRNMEGSVVAGIPVLFYSASGQLLARTTTDAHGEATGVVKKGGAVTIVEAAARKITTIFDIAPGDVLTVGDVGFWGPAPIGTATLGIPPGLDPPSEMYRVEGPCALSSFFTSTDLSVFLWPACGATRPIMATSYRTDPPNDITGYLLDPEVTLVPGGTATMDGAWSPAIMFDLAVSGLPADLGGFVLERFLGTQNIYRFATGTLPDNNGNVAARLSQAAGGDGTTTKLVFGFPGTPGGANEILEFHSGQLTSLVRDVSSDFIARPIFEGLTRDELTPGGPTGLVGASWAFAGPDSADGLVALLTVFDAEFALTTWTAVLPPGTLQYRLPSLPADLVHLWANRRFDTFRAFNVDTPVRSYREFRRDAEPEQPWGWMRAPATPGKVRIGM